MARRSSMSSAGWWLRAKSKTKDNWSICVVRTLGIGRHAQLRRSDVEAAVIRSTSHDERSVDYKNAGRIFTWARAAPSSLLSPLMWSVARRASRTRSWPVALKSLLLAHGLLLCADDAPPAAHLGRLPFDLSEFTDRSSAAPGFSAFVRAYFRFLDCRSHFFALRGSVTPETGVNIDADLERLEQQQILLELMMQIRPYADEMEVGLVLDAMDCVVIEIFEVYSDICNGIAHFLASVARTDPPTETTKRRRAVGLQIMRRAAVQSAHLSAYFDLCQELGVLNAADLPPVVGIPEKDMEDIEMMMLGFAPRICGGAEAKELLEEEEQEEEEEEEEEKATTATATWERFYGTVVRREWVLFEDEGQFENPPNQALIVIDNDNNMTSPAALMGDLIDLS